MRTLNTAVLSCILLGLAAAPLAAQAKSVLIIDNNPIVMGSVVVTNESLVLGAIQASAGNTVTYSDLLLPSFSAFDQIWDIRSSTPISAPLQVQYLDFLQGGGSLALIGENFIFKTRNDSILEVTDAAGAGTLSTTGAGDFQTVDAPFNGPEPITDITFFSAGGLFEIGHGKPITSSPFGHTGAAFDPGTLTNAPLGKLVVFFDSGLFRPAGGPVGVEGSGALTRNIIAYLGDEPVSTRGGVPEPASWSLMICGFGMAGGLLRRRRLQPA